MSQTITKIAYSRVNKKSFKFTAKSSTLDVVKGQRLQ